VTFEPGSLPIEPAATAASVAAIEWLPDGAAAEIDPAAILLTCANCGAAMDERKCKLICRCGYFLSCSDYY
jgi:hypothetical protein